MYNFSNRLNIFILYFFQIQSFNKVLLNKSFKEEDNKIAFLKINAIFSQKISLNSHILLIFTKILVNS